MGGTINYFGINKLDLNLKLYLSKSISTVLKSTQLVVEVRRQKSASWPKHTEVFK